MAVLYTNNASTLLTASITNAATSFSVTAGTGSLFPVVSGSDYFYITLVDNAGNYEIVKVTGRSTDTFTITRGQDGTSARAFSVGDKVELRIVKALLDDLKGERLPLTGGTLSGILNISPNFGINTSTVDFGAVVKFDNSYSDGARGPNKVVLYNDVGSWLSGLGIHNNTLAVYSGGVTTFYSGTTGYNAVGTATLSFDASSISYKGNALLHAGNYSSYAAPASHTHSYLPLSGGNLTGGITLGSFLKIATDNSDWLTGNYFRGASDHFVLGVQSGGTLYLNYGNEAGTTRISGTTLVNGNQVLHAGNYSSYALPLSGGTITGNIIAANNNVGGVFGNLEIGYGGRYNTLQTKTSSDTLWLQYGHSGPVGIAYGGGETTIYAKTKIQGLGVSNPTTADSTDNSILSLRATNALVRLQFGTRNTGNYSGWIQASYDNGGGANGTEPLDLNPLGGTVNANGNTILHAGNYPNYFRYNTWDDWLRDNNDDQQFKLYGNSRTVIFRTDGNTNDHGGGAYAYIWYYGGSNDADRRMILHTNGNLWTNSYGWLHDAFASTGHTHSWPSITSGYRENYDLGIRPADNSSSFAGFRFATPGNDANAGYLLIRGGADTDVYTQNGITLVADAGWLTLAQRYGTDKGVRLMTNGTTRLSVNYSGDIAFVNGNSINYNSGRMVYGDTYNGDENYNTGSIGRSGVNIDDIFQRRSGFIDVWAGGGTPPIGGYSHVTGFQSMHYWSGSTGYGLQVGGNHQNRSTLKFRWRSDNGINPWYDIIHGGNYSSYAVPISGGINMTGSYGLNDNRLYLRTNGDTNHYLWNADDDWEELVAYAGTGFRVKSSNGTSLMTVSTSAVTVSSDLYAGGRNIKIFEANSFIEFYVGGDANTYYPVRFDVSEWDHWGRWSISRHYSDTAPWDPLGTGVHHGGLTFTWEWTGDGAWGGNDHSFRVVQFSEQYTTQVGGMALSVNGMIVWLRGGNAYYRFHGPGGVANGATPYYSTFTASNGTTFSPRSYDSGAVSSEISWRFPVRYNGEFYEYNNRVLNASNYSSYALPLSGGTMSGAITMGGNNVNNAGQFSLNNGFTISQGGSNYGQFSSWVHLPGYHGLYSTNNSAHFYPNPGSYGSWRMDGSRNSWRGITFDGSVTLMMNDNESGHYKDGYGWQFRWYNGTMYVDKNTYGGGTESVVLDASNYTNYTLPIGGGWYGSGLPGSRWGGYSVNGGEISFGRDLPNNGQMGILVDGCYVAGENNGFWSLGSDNAWGGRRGMYWDGSYLNFTTNTPQARFSGVRSDSTVLVSAGHGDTRLQLRIESPNNPGTSYNGYLTAWVSEPGISWSFCGIGGNVNIGGQYYGRQVDTMTYATYIRWDTNAGQTQFWNSSGTPGAGGGQGSCVAYVNNDGNIYATTSQHTVLHAGNYSSYALPLSGGTISVNLGLGVAPDIRLSVNGEAHISSYLYMGGTAGSKNTWGSRDYTTSGNRYINANYFEVNNYGYGSSWSFAVDGGSSRYNGNVILHAGNYSSYALPLSGGTLSGALTINLSSGSMLKTGASSDAFGYNGSYGHYIAGNGGTYVYGNATFWDGSASRTMLHSGNSTSYDAYRASGQGGYPHAGWGMFAFYNWGGVNGGASAPYSNSYTVGLSVGSHPGDQNYGFQIARNMWNTGLWTRGYDYGWGSWVRLLDSSNYSSYALPLSGGTMSGTIGSSMNDLGRLFASYNTSASGPLQFYIDHSYGSVNIGNARGTINFAASGLYFGGQTILTGANISSYAPALTGLTKFTNSILRLRYSYPNEDQIQSNNAGIEINVTDASNPLIRISASGVGSATLPIWTKTSSQPITFRNYDTNGEYGYIWINSNGTTSYATSSDYRLKDIEGEISEEDSGAFIDGLLPKYGTWKSDGSVFVGFVAHEVQTVAKTEIATGPKDGPRMQAIDYSSPELIANLVAQVKFLRARVEELEGKINS